MKERNMSMQLRLDQGLKRVKTRSNKQNGLHQLQPENNKFNCDAPIPTVRRTDPQVPGIDVECRFEALDDSGDEQEVEIEDFESDEDWFDELDEWIIKEDSEEVIDNVESVDELEREELEEKTVNVDSMTAEEVEEREDEVKDVEEELMGLIGEEAGDEIKLFDINVNNMTSEHLEKYLNDNHDPGSKEGVIEEEDGDGDIESCDALGKEPDVDNPIEKEEKSPVAINPPLQGMAEFIDNFISLLIFREDEGYEDTGARPFQLRKKKCKNRCKHIDELRELAIFASTKEWNDAMVKNFDGLYVSNETLLFDGNGSLYDE